VQEQEAIVDPTVCSELAAILISRYERVLRALEESGHPYFQKSRVTDFDLSGEVHVLRRFTDRRPVLESDEIRHHFEYEVLDLTFPDDNELAATARIITALGKSFHQPWHHIPADDDVDPEIELFQTVIWPLSDYFISLAPIGVEIDKLANHLANQVLMTLATGSGSIIERVALDGVAVDQPLTVDRIVLKPLTTIERASISARYSRASSYAIQLVGPDLVEGASGTCMLEARTHWNVVESPPASLFWADRVVLAMELLGITVAGPGWVHTSTNPRYIELDSRRSLRVPSRAPEAKPLNTLLLDQVAQLAELIPQGAVAEPANRHDVALNRFFRGCAAQTPSDALLEHTIALEAILLPFKFEGELAYRLRVNAAWLLGRDRAERAAIAHKVNRIYTLRSALVHGLKPPNHDEVNEASGWARVILSDLLRHCLKAGWPRDTELAQLALG
jgi:hypothetical protein